MSDTSNTSRGSSAGGAGAGKSDPKDNIAQIAEQVAAILAEKGNAAYRTVGGVMSDAGAKAGEAREAVSEVAESFTDAIDESLERRPYTTLALALGLGFVIGALWKR